MPGRSLPRVLAHGWVGRAAAWARCRSRASEVSRLCCCRTRAQQLLGTAGSGEQSLGPRRSATPTAQTMARIASTGTLA